MLTTGSSNFPDPRLVKSGARKIMQKFSNTDSLKGIRFFSQESYKDTVREYAENYGIGIAGRVAEGATPSFQMDRPGYRKVVSTHKKGTGRAFSREARMLAPDQIALAQRQLSNSRERTVELDLGAFYTYALDGSTVPTEGGANLVDNLGIDGLEVFHGSHTFAGTGVTNSNIQTATLSLSGTTLTTVRQQGRAWLDDQGIALDLEPRGIVVGDNLVETAKVILNTMQVTGSANNDDNPVRYTGIEGVDHWSLMGTSDWMVRWKLPEGERGWCVDWFEKNHVVTSGPEAKERWYVYFTMNYAVYCLNPLEYITNKVAAA